MSTTPSPEFKSSQYEFTDEQNRTITQLADSMGTVAMLIKVLGLAFLVFFAVTLYHAIQVKGNYAPAAGLGAATLLCLAIGFWTGASAHSFRRVVVSKNEDIWHLMNALGSLHNMYGLLRTIILGSLVLAVVGLALVLGAFAFKG